MFYTLDTSFDDAYRCRLGNKPLSSTQSIALSGLGSDEFDLSLKGLTCIHNVFKEHLAGTSFSGINTHLDNSYVTLFFSNRYFTHPRDMQNNTAIPIPPDVDPVGILAGISGGIYTAENQVEYFERTSTNGKL